jgi:hypothetical protein
MTGKRGAQPVYADLTIETALTFQLLFHLPLRQTAGFLRSVLQLMEVPLPCPDHTTLSRRHPTVALRQHVDRASAGPLSLIVDSSGLQVWGQRAWQAQKHGEKKPKRWKKLPIGVDAQGQIGASAVTASSRFCQVVEAEMVIRQAGASPRSYPPFRRPAPCLSLRPHSRIAAASLDDSQPLTTDAVAGESGGEWGRRQTENAGHAPLI